MRLDQKTALVTGAAGGIGNAIVALFRAEGARVVATDLAPPVQPSDMALALDVTKEADWTAALDAAQQRFGQIDILVNNAGYALSKPLQETSLEEWRQVIGINLEGTFLGVREGLKRLAPGGSIINLASVAALVAAPPLGAYSAAKGAVVALTRTAAITAADAGQGLRVNALCPGFTDTGMLDSISAGMGDAALVKAKLTRRQPLGRICTPPEIAEAALYLASDAARYVTGTTLTIDGGFTAQ